MATMKWNNAYSRPFKIEEKNSMMVLTSDGNKAFELHSRCSKKMAKEIVDILNGKIDKTINVEMIIDEDEITFDGKVTIMLRGWSHLISDLGLKSRDAEDLQDSFADWIVKTLKKSE